MRRVGGADEDFVNKAKGMPMRAPMVITVVAKTQQHPKVPVLWTTNCSGLRNDGDATGGFALGIGAVWRTGRFCLRCQCECRLRPWATRSNRRLFVCRYASGCGTQNRKRTAANTSVIYEKLMTIFFINIVYFSGEILCKWRVLLD